MNPAEVVKANTRAAFDEFYAATDFIATSYLDATRLALYDLVAMRCAAPPATNVLDVGCGLGHGLLAVRHYLPAAALTGLDFSTVALAHARSLLPAATFVAGDLYATPFADGAFDLVLCLETLEHVLDPTAALGELRRLCAPGGRVVLTVPNGEIDRWDGHRHFWTPAQLTEFLRPYGLRYLALRQDDTVILAELIKG